MERLLSDFSVSLLIRRNLRPRFLRQFECEGDSPLDNDFPPKQLYDGIDVGQSL